MHVAGPRFRTGGDELTLILSVADNHLGGCVGSAEALIAMQYRRFHHPDLRNREHEDAW